MKDKFKEKRGKLIQDLVNKGYIKTEKVKRAFLKIPRENFVLERYKEHAYVDTALPIIAGQTISQPLTIAFMTELLNVKEGHKILEVGAGSGYQAAILSEIVGKKGIIYTTEIIPELVEFSKRNLKKSKIKNVKVIEWDGSKGYEKEDYYDRIMVTAAASKIPEPLKEQLKIKGKMVIPIETLSFCGLVLVEKISKNKFKEKKFHGFVFVPLIGEL